MFVPVANAFIWAIVWMYISKARNKSFWLGLLMFVPLVNIFWLGHLAFYKDNSSSLLATNAPAHWPKIIIDNSIANEDPKVQAMDSLFFIDAFSKVLLPSQQLLEVSGNRLTELGLIYVSARILENDKIYDIFFYPKGSKEDAAAFTALQVLYRLEQLPTPIYFSTKTLTRAKVKPLSPQQLASFEDLGVSKLEQNEEVPNGNYGMWWPTPQEPTFSDSLA